MAHDPPRHSLAKERIRIVLLEGIHGSAVELLHAEGYTQIVAVPRALAGDALAEQIAEAHILGIRSRTQVTEDVLARAPRLVAIGAFCIGTNQVDLAAAMRRGIPVFNAPFSNTRSVAELVIAEVVMLMRGIPQKNAALHRHVWTKSAAGAREVRGKTLGIVGYGHIGTQVGVLAEHLGMHVVFHDIETRLPLGNARQLASLGAVLDEADVVTLHVPETGQTRNLFDVPTIARMKRGSHLVNASRGTVVDIAGLAEALRSGHLAGAAIDVFPQEPQGNDSRFDSPLVGIEQALLTPHIGGSTEEAQENIGREVAAKLVRYSDNGSTMTAVNFPEVSLPEHGGRCRLLHIHRNVPGILARINERFSASGINVAAQYLRTNEEVGYVVIDVDAAASRVALQELCDIPGTIRCRVLY